MKTIRTKEVNENVKVANNCLRKAKRQAKELAVFAGEVVRLMDKEGHSLQGFFNRVEFVLVDGTIKFRVVINPILECVVVPRDKATSSERTYTATSTEIEKQIIFIAKLLEIHKRIKFFKL